MYSDLTERQFEVYYFIKNYREMHGFAPSIKDIGKGCYINSDSNILRYIGILIDRGYILYEPNTARSIRICK